MIRLIVISVILCAIAFALLSVRVMLKPGGRFSSAHACRFNKRQGHKDERPGSNDRNNNSINHQ